MMGGMSAAGSPAASSVMRGAGAVGGAVTGAVGGAAVMGLGAAVAVGQSAANYGSFYGAAAKQDFNNMRNITKQNRD